MTTNNISSSLSQKPAAAADEKPMLTPEQFIEQLHALREQIPEFVRLPNSRELAKLRSATRVTTDLTLEAVNAVGTVEVVRDFVGSTPEELRQAQDESSRWTSAENELRLVLRGVSAANVIRRHRIARAVQQAYTISRTLAGREQFSDLVPHVETMTRIKRRRTKPAVSPDDQKKQ
jgi:hypothetical protein